MVAAVDARKTQGMGPSIYLSLFGYQSRVADYAESAGLVVLLLSHMLVYGFQILLQAISPHLYESRGGRLQTMGMLVRYTYLWTNIGLPSIVVPY